MIIIGYPGIGKSTLVKENLGAGFIDLESSIFKTDERRPIDTVHIYCKTALELSRQGYIVFISSHESVRRTLLEYFDSCDDIMVCYPSLELKCEWIKRLRNRCQNESYDEITKNKNLAALERALDCYDQDIAGLHNSGFNELIITDEDYKLGELLSAMGIEVNS